MCKEHLGFHWVNQKGTLFEGWGGSPRTLKSISSLTPARVSLNLAWALPEWHQLTRALPQRHHHTRALPERHLIPPMPSKYCTIGCPNYPTSLCTNLPVEQHSSVAKCHPHIPQQ
ncbi:hypothetical protein FKM82_007481 [Ascaphus truei]